MRRMLSAISSSRPHLTIVRSQPRWRPFPWIIVLLMVTLLLPACDRTGKGGSLQQIRKRGELIILTRNAPTTYYEGRDGLAGLEYDMATDFADYLGVRAKFRIQDTVSEILDAIAEGKGDIAAAGLTKTPNRTETYRVGPVYQHVEQQVACRSDGKRPADVAGLADISLMVVAGSSYVERLTRLKEDHLNLKWRVTETLDTEQLLEQVWNRQLDCTVADSSILAINRRYLPELVMAFNLTEPEPLAWMLPPDATELQESAEVWFSDFQESGRLDQLLEKYYGFIEIFDYVDTRVFVRRTEEVMPEYRPLFLQAAEQTGLGWTLLAAQSYQESHWKPDAVSPTGVKGIMMLTRPTAREVGIEDRLDPEESIRGGARYLSRLRDRLPMEIQEPDRTWIALAAYNVGMAHLQDARKLAQRLDKNPNVWRDLSEVLPLLSQKKYYRTLKYGYARGREPVRYVNRIRDYRDLLEQTLNKDK